MPGFHSVDSMVRNRLSRWPQHPPGLKAANKTRNTWMRGRPSTNNQAYTPFLKLPGSDRMRTLPDGLWLNFGGSPVEPFVDILAIEACSSLSNLLDKRSRFAPSTQSMLAVCPVPWLLAPMLPGGTLPRWVVTRLLNREPEQPFVVPVRDLRVLYGLKSHHYDGFALSQIPHAHEYFVPMEALTAENGDKDPGLRALLSRACASSNFLSYPERRRMESAVFSPSALRTSPLRPSFAQGLLANNVGLPRGGRYDGGSGARRVGRYGTARQRALHDAADAPHAG
jgi:hypothetical protein